MLGAAAVGKTSLVRRFVEGIFHEEYVTTIGVNIQKKEVTLEDTEVTLLLWDLNGEDRFQSVSTSYLRGMGGYLLVADGTRPETLDTALTLHDRAQDAAGEVPFYLLVNKVDLKGAEDVEWRLSSEVLEDHGLSDWPVLYTSAKDGTRVEEAFTGLARASGAPS
jgi:small GTP-binding protein